MNRRDFLFLVGAGAVSAAFPVGIMAGDGEIWVKWRMEQPNSVNYAQGIEPLNEARETWAYFPGLQLVSVEVLPA